MASHSEEDRRSPSPSPFHQSEGIEEASCIPPLHPSSVDQTPIMAPSARQYSHPFPSSIFTPEACRKSTPLTVLMTPEYEDADDPSSVAKQLLTSEGGLFDTSSTEAADSSKSSEEYTLDDVLRLGREPSKPNRALYHYDHPMIEDLYDSPDNSMHSSNHSFERVYVDGSPYRSSNGTADGDSRDYSFHRSARKHHLRSRRSSYYANRDSQNSNCPLAVVKLPEEEYHPAAAAVEMQYLSTDSEEEEDVFLLPEDPTERYHREAARYKPRRSSSVLRRSSPTAKPRWRAFTQRISRTQTLVWLLCFVGLTSVTMMVTLNHQMGHVSSQHQDHLAVLFPHPLSYSKVSPQAASVPHERTSETTTIRGATRKKVANSNRRTVNLNTLAQILPEKGDKKVVVDRPAHVEPHHHHDHHHHHHDTQHHHDAPNHHGVSHSQHTKHHHDADSNDGADSVSHQPKPWRLYIAAKPGILGMEAIPPVIQPSVWDDDAVAEPAFDFDDTELYDSSNDADTVYPRMVFLHGPFARTEDRSIRRYRSEFTDSTQLYPLFDSGDERVASTMELRAPLVQGECVPMQEWQTTFNPSCNGMHELDMSSMGDDRSEDDFKLFGMNGFWRNAWRYDSTGGHSSLAERDTVVLKTLRINHRFEDAYFENNRIDAVVLERLTASPHVINVFGFCGHSVITEFADGKRLGELADKMAKVPLARLQIARDIANGLADVHGIDGDGNATFVHLDINPANVVSIGGTLKLNDFNIGVLRRWNTTSNTPCGIPAKYPNPQWRSPEEARLEQNLTEKVDVFSLGHIFFRLICSHEPWHKLEPGGMPSKETLNEKVKHGILPTIPEDILNSPDPEIMAIRDAMLRCYTYDPVRRPSAREIANSLQESLNMLEMQAATEIE